MVQFERRDPFPHLAPDSFSKKEARDHSREVDRYLGLNVDQIERQLTASGSSAPAKDASGDHQQLWFGLDPQDLLTPYIEIRATLESLKQDGFFESSKHVVDLGAAYARMGFVIERHFSNVSFTGYEYVGERVFEAARALNKIGAQRSWIEHADLTSSSFQLPFADIYFIYDYGTPKAIEKTLHDLKRISSARQILIVARGRACRYSIESRHAWLRKANPLAPERAITVYRSELLELRDVSF